MRNPDRIPEIMNLLTEIWLEVPDLRLCQLLHAAKNQINYPSNDLFYLEDEDLLNGLKQLGD